MKYNSGILAVVLAAIIGIVVIWTGNHFGFWWLTALVGLAIGVSLRGVWTTLLAATFAGVGGWGLDLLWQSLHVNVGGAASVVSGIVGFGVSNGFIVILSTLILAWLLSLTGTWVGAALRRIVLDLRAYGYSSRHAGSNAINIEVAPSQTGAIASPETAPIQTSEGGALTS